MSYTDAQKFRAARAVLKWTQTQLGKKGGVCATTIAQFENEKRDMYHNNKMACWKAFADAGITFRGNAMVFNPPKGIPIPLVTTAGATTPTTQTEEAATNAG